MKTKFQQDIKKEDLVAVTKMLHPELDINVIEQRIKYNTSYTWVVVEFRVKKYGSIDFAISNHDQKIGGLSGDGITKVHIKKALQSGNIYFRCWRMTCDKLYDKDATGREIFHNQYEPAILEVQKYMSERYELPTVDEFYNNYYTD